MRRPLLIGAGLLLVVPVLWACAPGGMLWILGQDDLVLHGPAARFSQEIRELAPEGTRFRQPPDAPWAVTAEADRADLEKALAQLGTPPARRGEILARHAALRQALSENAGGLSVQVPEGLPPEHADYLRGAIAFHERRFPEAAAIWERLLARPAAERRFRSIWAAFMLGKTYLRGDRALAVKWFQTTRELAADGFHDSLGLAAASVGWEARAERDRGRFDRALALYVRQLADGDLTAEVSIRIVGRAALNAGPEALQAVARDPDAREAMTVFVVAPDAASLLPESDADATAWLQALQAAGIEEIRGADRLAWAAYPPGSTRTRSSSSAAPRPRARRRSRSACATCWAGGWHGQAGWTRRGPTSPNPCGRA
jgi:tetratricopeptide (TPR) repeat protein